MVKCLHTTNFCKIITIAVLSKQIFFFKKPRVWFFAINVVGRIFKWTKYTTYMDFIIPIINKPYLFWFYNTVNLFPKNKQSLCISNSQIPQNTQLLFLLKIKKPSIFNKRGYIILNKVNYKKKGKVTSYITNK